MTTSQHVPARYVALMVQHLETQGIDCTEALHRARIPRAALGHTDAQLPADQIVSATRLLTEASGGQSGLALAVGAMIGPGQLGELGRAMLSCATVKDSLALCARYYELVTPSFSLRTRQVGLCYELCWQPVLAVPYDLMLAAFDLALMSFHTRMKSLLRDELPGYDVYLFSPEPKDLRPYQALKPARCHFGQGGLPALRIVIDEAVLAATPMPMANASDLAEAEQRLQSRLQSTPAPRDWRAWVAMMLHEAQGHQPTQDELAALVGLSASTLARHLAAQGTSFRALSNEIRHEKACHWLAQGHLLVTDVARLLGYTDAANFIRAFKLRAGISPSRYAQQGHTAQATRLSA